MRLGTTPVGELLVEVNGPIEREATIIVEINVQRLKISGRVDYPNITSLNKVVGDNEVLLIRSDLNVVGANRGLILIRVIQTLDVVQVADIQCGNMVGCGESGVEVFTILANVGAVD